MATTPEQIPTTCAFRRQATAKRSNMFVQHGFGRQPRPQGAFPCALPI